MARRVTAPRLVIASHNPGKIREISDLLSPFGVSPVAAAEFGLTAPEETGDSFAANARLKAAAAAAATGLPALADDSGLAVAALGGAPGIQSARWARPDGDFGAAMTRVMDSLPEGADRSAWFVCALAVCWPDDHCEIVEGRVTGTLVWPPRGERGFGYDPIFQPDGHSETFGEIDPAMKNAMSHRADAFRKLIDACFAG